MSNKDKTTIITGVHNEHRFGRWGRRGVVTYEDKWTVHIRFGDGDELVYRKSVVKNEAMQALCVVPGVTYVEVDTLKRGTICLRVIGGKLLDVVTAIRTIKPATTGVVVQHQDDAESTVVELTL